MNRGKLAVLSMFALAVGLAGFGLWWNVTSGRRTLEFWGREAGARIIRPEASVELLWLSPMTLSPMTLSPMNRDPQVERLTIGQRSYAVVAATDVTGARGLVHARHSLLADGSFVWDAPPVPASDYSLAARFRDDAGTTTVAFDFGSGQLAHVETGRQQRAAAKIMAGWQTFAQRHQPPGVSAGN